MKESLAGNSLGLLKVLTSWFGRSWSLSHKSKAPLIFQVLSGHCARSAACWSKRSRPGQWDAFGQQAWWFPGPFFAPSHGPHVSQVWRARKSGGLAESHLMVNVSVSKGPVSSPQGHELTSPRLPEELAALGHSPCASFEESCALGGFALYRRQAD